jgi:hypothetical protein
MFGPKKEEVTRVWRRLHKVELHYLYSTSNIFSCYHVNKNELRGACGTYVGEDRCMQPEDKA